MSSKNSLIQVPWPKRVNSDISPSMLAADETPVLRNVKTRSLPYDVRPRNGMKYLGTWRAAVATGGTGTFKDNSAAWIPYHAMFSPNSDNMIVGLVKQEANDSPDWPFYYSYQQAYDGYVASAAASGVLGNGIQFPFLKPNPTYLTVPYAIGKITASVTSTAFTVTNESWRSDGETSNFWGLPVYYDGTVFYTKADPIGLGGLSIYSKYSDTSTSPTKSIDLSVAPYYALNRVVQWGGVINPTASITDPLSRAPSATATANNASVTVTLGGASAYSYAGFIFQFQGTPGTSGMSNPAYTFGYRVKSQTSGSTALVLERPYALGETTANVPNITPAVTIKVQPTNHILGAPAGIWCLALFNDRLFGGRARISAALSTGAPQGYPSPVGEYGGDYPNALVWSKPGNPQRWPDQNFALVGEDGGEPITGLAVVGDKLIIFKPHRTYVMTGYDEDSFQIDKLSDVVGCPYPNGMVQYEGVLYFCDQNGVWATDGETVRSISAPQPGHGITALWNTRKWSRAQGMSDHYFWPTMAVTPDAHLVVCCHYPLSTTDYADNFVYDIRNEAWSEWGVSDKTLNPIRVVTAPNGKVYGIHRWFITEITDCWNVGVNGQVYDEYPVLSTGTLTKLAVVPEVEVWFNASPGNTFRVNEMQVDHKVHYAHTSSGVTYQPWTIQFATDPDLVLSSTQHSITARWTDSATYDTTQPRHYSDRLPETYQREAQTMRVKLTGNTYPDANLRMKDWTLLAMKFTVSTTRQMGVDNSTT